MKTRLTITGKGQTTIPVEMRRALGVPEEGGYLDIDMDLLHDALVITRPPSIEEVRAIARKYLKPGVEPLEDVNGWLREHRWGIKD